MFEVVAVPSARGLVVIVLHVGLFLDRRRPGQRPPASHARQQQVASREAQFHLE